ncbi:cytochrome p450 2u1 [Plakobranchus ocellatus]|uniref:Cytochrome p450 2u1 n=1 Tax=Plakobranchus ocellatus TaxID=259542 RepID=A0AAV3Y3I0_9GAST|nr:cytochrome p450 2u1 [Plakobranchus ocellatus]
MVEMVIIQTIMGVFETIRRRALGDLDNILSFTSSLTARPSTHMMSTLRTDDQWLGPVLAYTAVVIGVIYLVKSVIRPTYPANIPPFPEKPYPILGHLPYLAKGDRRKKMLEWRKTLSIVFANGAIWKEQRAISLSILRSFGMGKSSLSSKINEEVVAAENISPVAIWPWLRFVPGNFLNSKTRNIIYKKILSEFSDKFIELNEEQRKKGEAETFITSYLDEIEKLQKQGKETSIGKPCLRRVLLQLFVAGTDTSATTIIWFMLFMLHHPHIQNKVFEEIEQVIGRERTPDIQERVKLPYTNATIMETQRLGSIVPTKYVHVHTVLQSKSHSSVKPYPFESSE